MVLLQVLQEQQVMEALGVVVEVEIIKVKVYQLKELLERQTRAVVLVEEVTLQR